METPKNTQEARIASLLKLGQIGVFPSDTIYGVHGLALNQAVVERIYKLKVRPKQKPFIILIHSLEDLKLFGFKIDNQTRQILQQVWPGKVSVVLGSTAFRMPEDALLRRILEKTGPLISTSANLSGQDPAKNITGAKNYFGEKVDFYIDGGNLAASSSTVVSLSKGKMKILRQGEVNLADLGSAAIDEQTKT